MVIITYFYRYPWCGTTTTTKSLTLLMIRPHVSHFCFQYTYLLTSQLENQRHYFQEKITQIEKDAAEQVNKASNVFPILYPKLGFFVICSHLSLNAHLFKADTEFHTKTDTELVTRRTAVKIGDLSPKFCFTCYGDQRKWSHLGFNWSADARNPKYILRYATGFISRRDCGASCCLHIFPPKKETDTTLNTDTYCCSYTIC